MKTMTCFRFLVIVFGVCFLVIGCAGTYRLMGLTEEQVEQEVAKDAELTIQVAETGRELLWQVISVAVAGVGAILTGFLAKWVGTERKVSKAVILGVEAGNEGGVKGAIATAAKTLGVETALSARVKKLTG